MQVPLAERSALGSTSVPSRVTAPRTGTSFPFGNLLGNQSHPSAKWWPERLAAVLALAGVVGASLPGYHVRERQDSGSDFKTVYASGKCFLQGLRAYDFGNIGSVFHRYGVVLPSTWYAHAPTYPPFTFAALAPLFAMPMVAAVYAWLIVSTIALAMATWALAGASQRALGLPRGWRLLLLVLVTASPLVSFALQIGNVSVVACALCVVAVMCTDVSSPNWLAAALTYSLMLKPHVALCLMLGMLVSRNRQDRALALRALAFLAAALVCFVVIFAFRAGGMQLHEYAAMVSHEMVNGCLNPRNHELLPPVAEITSLESLFGFYLTAPALQVTTGTGLLMLLGALVYVSRRAANGDAATRLELLGAWSAFGLLATYHRSHDGIVLLLLLPWVLVRLQRKLLDATAWAVLLLPFLMSLGSEGSVFGWVIRLHGPRAFANLLVFRQSAVAALALTIVLVGDLWRQARSRSFVLVPEAGGWHKSSSPTGGAAGALRGEMPA